jgi:homocysteine S-methyltransferase
MTAWLSFSCRDSRRNSEGEDVGACAAALQHHAQIAALGVNCTGPDYVESLLRRMGARTDKPLLAYPNSGETYDAVVHDWKAQAHEPHPPLGAQAHDWYEAGARLIGGCCRTTPADIADLAARLHAAPRDR